MPCARQFYFYSTVRKVHTLMSQFCTLGSWRTYAFRNLGATFHQWNVDGITGPIWLQTLAAVGEGPGNGRIMTYSVFKRYLLCSSMCPRKLISTLLSVRGARLSCVMHANPDILLCAGIILLAKPSTCSKRQTVSLPVGIPTKEHQLAIPILCLKPHFITST